MKAQLHRPSVRALTVTQAKELPVSQAPTREPGASHSTFGRSRGGTCGPFANSSMNLCARILKVKRDSDSSSGCENNRAPKFSSLGSALPDTRQQLHSQVPLPAHTWITPDTILLQDRAWLHGTAKSQRSRERR